MNHSRMENWRSRVSRRYRLLIVWFLLVAAAEITWIIVYVPKPAPYILAVIGAIQLLFCFSGFAVKPQGLRISRRSQAAGQYARAEEVVANLSRRIELAPPKVYLLEQGGLYDAGCSTGGVGSMAAVLFPREYIERAPETHLEATVAHELQHIKSDDMFVRLLLKAVLSTILNSGFSALLLCFIARNHPTAAGFFPLAATAIPSGILLGLLYAAAMRMTEYRADSLSVMLVDKPGEVEASLDALDADAKKELESFNRIARFAYLVTFRNRLASWFHAHPSTADRNAVSRWLCE